tara:strand:- start:116 stop:406 length:291 start_codon:yes stop_codon:yes gene_type:complete
MVLYKLNRDKMINTFQQAKSKFLDRVKKTTAEYNRIPCIKFSTEKMGGWILRDQNDMYVGWVGNKGDITFVDYRDTTPNNVSRINPNGLGFDRVQA